MLIALTPVGRPGWRLESKTPRQRCLRQLGALRLNYKNSGGINIYNKFKGTNWHIAITHYSSLMSASADNSLFRE